MDQTVDGAVGGCLQRVVGTVQPVLQRLQAESQTDLTVVYKCIPLCAVTRWGKFKVLAFSVGCAFTYAK